MRPSQHCSLLLAKLAAGSVTCAILVALEQVEQLRDRRAVDLRLLDEWTCGIRDPPDAAVLDVDLEAGRILVARGFAPDDE